MAPYMYKFIPVSWQSEGTDSTGYPPWLYGLEKIYPQLKRVQGEETIKKQAPILKSIQRSVMKFQNVLIKKTIFQLNLRISKRFVSWWLPL